MVDFIGIDLTQSKPHLAIATGPSKVEGNASENSPPAALLPALKGESIIVGSASHRHRRGIGDNWPPECQVPVGGDFQNGVGRIPIVCAWVRLSKFSGLLGDTEFFWQPPGQKRLHSTAEKIIADSVQSWKKKFNSKRTVVVVPDNLGEAAQQSLVDSCGAFLIPRPIAVAMSWCRKNTANISTPPVQSDRGITLGHLLVVTLPFDRWEIVPIEIRALFYKEKMWLLPIRNRIAGGGEFPRIGANLHLAMANRERSLERKWKTVFGGGFDSDLLAGKWANTDSYNLVRGCIENGFSPRTKSLFCELDGWKDLFLKAPSLSPSHFKELLFKIYKNQLENLPKSTQDKCLGVVIDGSCSDIPIAENRLLGEFVASTFENLETDIYNGVAAAKGAAITAYALENDLPSYRETIVPVDIHYHGRNEKGDYVNAYKSLVEGKTVEAGKEYRSEKPVRGLNIKQGENNLTLTLRRSEKSDDYLFRRVTAVIPKVTTIDEEVKIVAHLSPGQGFAKVFIDSVNEGVFNTRLDWKTMEDCVEPPPPPLAYLPEVSRVVHNKDMWESAGHYVNKAIEDLRTGGDNLLRTMSDLREPGKFNQWPSADAYDKYRGHTPKGDSFRHYGICPSDGDLETVSAPSLMKRFANECARKFMHKETTSAQRQQIQRTASWMYLACPPDIINQVRKNLRVKQAQITQVDLHTIGLCWCDSEDIKLFFKALEKRLLQGRTNANEWLRTCRNIVRFRDAALNPNIISGIRLKIILSCIVKILKGQIQEGNFSRIFDNCILTCLYLLKRRRYDEKFLNSESSGAYSLEIILESLLNKKALSDKQYTIIRVTLKFLKKEASMNDINESVLTG